MTQQSCTGACSPRGRVRQEGGRGLEVDHLVLANGGEADPVAQEVCRHVGASQDQDPGEEKQDQDPEDDTQDPGLEEEGQDQGLEEEGQDLETDTQDLDLGNAGIDPDHVEEEDPLSLPSDQRANLSRRGDRSQDQKTGMETRRASTLDHQFLPSCSIQQTDYSLVTLEDPMVSERGWR